MDLNVGTLFAYSLDLDNATEMDLMDNVTVPESCKFGQLAIGQLPSNL